MKLKSTALIVLCSMVAMNSYSQDTETVTSEKSMFLSEAYISFGGESSDFFNNTKNNFQRLAPNATLIPNEDMTFTGSENYLNSYNSFFHIALGIGFRDKNNPGTNRNVTLRAGFSYVNSYGLDGLWENEESYAYDTLVSKSSGKEYIMDSIYSESLNYEYTYEQIRLDVAILYRSNTRSKFSVFGGIGFSTGLSINSSTNVTYNEYSTISERENRTYDPYENPFNIREVDNTESESFTNKTNYNTSIYVPIGVDFRFSNNHQLWKMVHLYYEMRPSVNYLFVPELGGRTSALFSNNLGLRIKFA